MSSIPLKDVVQAVVLNRRGGGLENLAQVWSRTIAARDEIPTASGDGKSWFISAKDIGEAAAEKLSSPSPIRGDARVLGPEAF